MGTRGYYVYRYRNIYFVYYANSDSYPRSLGITMLQSMRQPNAIAKERQRFREISDKLRDPSHPRVSQELRRERFDEGLDFIPVKNRLQNDVWIEWIYEIDLDRNIFHINGIPFYSLECLPDDEDFIDYISKDHHGNLACSRRCPPEHRYKKPAPPIVSDSDLATYESLECTGHNVALSHLLAINDTLSPDEHIRVSLLETMIGQCMVRSKDVGKDDWPDVGQMTCDIEIAIDHNTLTDKEWMTACSMANLAFIPQIFDDICEYIFHPKLRRMEFTWVREDTVVCIATHLDDERCLQASISRLINAILEQKNSPGDYFGVAFSVYHCAIVKVVKGAHTTTFSHTAVLQFLPSFNAYSPSTPGITALAYLGYRVDPALFVSAAKVCAWWMPRYGHKHKQSRSLSQRADEVPPHIDCAALPFEIWGKIALHLDLYDVLVFGCVSKLFREVASMVLRYPHVCGYRLVAVPTRKPESLRSGYRFLRSAAFSAERADIPATVIIGLRDTSYNQMKIPFAEGYSPSVPVSVEEVTNVEDR
ncbi:hypothetical protein K503DRAFT_723914 [Rhizopogon vinicolor AM-OR11-026]|uniref:F-box domain-containing protein n=1 Tax=Rhizopogon vinicolor AM-OR11-026 TaxID=1314800 RepID=A0A1B7MQC2_9AGAM|nr:hypothetical protein K503DRAFT_723914 [Rhizopogon vinicolor AM-OR11-026]